MAVQEARACLNDHLGAAETISLPPIMITVQGYPVDSRADGFAVELLPAATAHCIVLPLRQPPLRGNETFAQGNSDSMDALPCEDAGHLTGMAFLGRGRTLSFTLDEAAAIRPRNPELDRND